MGGNQGLQVDTKGCSFGASEVGSEEKGLLSTTTHYHRKAEVMRLKA